MIYQQNILDSLTLFQSIAKTKYQMSVQKSTNDKIKSEGHWTSIVSINIIWLIQLLKYLQTQLLKLVQRRRATIIQILSFIMFRNTYLELYKTSAGQQESLPILISHFNQIYNTLGCVLQDLQFQVGKMLAQQNSSQPPNKLEKVINHPNNLKKSNDNKEADKEIIKIEESVDNHFIAELEDQKRSLKQKMNLPIKTEAAQSRKRFIGENWNALAQSPKESQVMEKIRHQARQNIGGDSFDSLFDPRNSNIKSPMEIESRPGFNQSGNMPSIAQQSKEQSQPPADNTYEDFLDRIFREQDSRKSR